MPRPTELATTETFEWLLAGDPSVRWQVYGDLLGASATAVASEQARVAREGWGAELLARQDEQGTWASGLYTPKWTSTHYTLLTLRRLGLPRDDPRALTAARILLNAGFLPDHGINFSKAAKTHAETCISGMCLSLFAYFTLDDERVELLAGHLLGQQLADGGWNCRSYRGATHSSFHTTTSVLEGLHEYLTRFPGRRPEVAPALERGREFLLHHRLYRSHRTGEVVSEAMTRFPFPPQWQHDVLRALEHFAAAKAPRDERLDDAVALLLSRRDDAGRWPQYRGPAGKYHFPFETVGKASRANTVRALKVLKWWSAA